MYEFGQAATRRDAIEAARKELEEIREVRALEEAVLAEMRAEVEAFEAIRAETQRIRAQVETTRRQRKSLKLLPPPVYGGTEGLLAAANEIDQWNKTHREKVISA